MNDLDVAAYKSLVADLTLRTRQAEELTATLLLKTIDEETLRTQILDRIVYHLEERDIDRARHYKFLLETTRLALTEMTKKDFNRDDLLEVVKALTVASK